MNVTDPGLALTQTPAVVLCAPLRPDDRQPDWVAPVHAALTAEGVAVIRPESAGPELARWVGATAAAVTQGAPTGTLLVVSAGPTLQALPPLAVALRALRRSIAGYVVVDADPSAAMEHGEDWPGAPVTYVATDGPADAGWRIAGLRGWTRVAGDPAHGILIAAGLLSSSQDTSGEG